MNVQEIIERRNAVAREISEVRFMQKGTISYQRVPRTVNGRKTGAMRGPYPVLTWKHRGKTRSLRLKTEEELQWAEQAVANHRRFAALCREYEELAEGLAHEMRIGLGDTEMAETLKKGLKSRSRRAGKSTG